MGFVYIFDIYIYIVFLKFYRKTFLSFILLEQHYGTNKQIW